MSNRIDLVEIMDEDGPKEVNLSDGQKDWKEVLQEIRQETNNFDVESMCERCIAEQKANSPDGGLTIQCTGLNTYKNKVVSEHGEEVYNQLANLLSADQLSHAEQIANPEVWMEENVKDRNI